MKDSSLTEFISCYFNQDWMELAPDPDSAIRLYAYLEGPVEEVAEAASEARALVALDLPSAELYERLSTDHGLDYMPYRDGWEANAWLSHAAEILEAGLAARR